MKVQAAIQTDEDQIKDALYQTLVLVPNRLHFSLILRIGARDLDKVEVEEIAEETVGSF